MKDVKKVLFSIFILMIGFMTIRVNAATIKDNSEDFTTDVYIMGGTKFTKTVTSDLAFDAGLRYSDLLEQFPDLYEGKTVKTYYYNHIYKKWYVVPRNGGKLESTTPEEKEYLKNDLYTFYENDEEKVIEFDPGMEIDKDYDYYEEVGVKYEDGKFKIPATLTAFDFVGANGEYYWVDTNYNAQEKEMEYGEFYIPDMIRVYDYNDKDEVINDTDSVETRISFDLTKEGYVKVIDEEELYQSWDSKAVEGYVDQDGNPVDMLNTKFTKDSIVFQVLKDAVINVGQVNYSIDNFDKAIEMSSSYWPARLLSTDDGELIVNKLITLDKENAEMNLDLNGQTLSRDNGKFVLYVTGKNSSLNIYSTNGSGIIENEAGQAVTVGQSSTVDQNINVYIESSVIINTKGIGIAVMGKGANLNFRGIINLLKEGASGISGRGNQDDAGANIYLENATIQSELDKTYGLYLPQEGNTTIRTSNINTATAIGIKAGTLNLESANLHAYGTRVEPTLNGNGVNSTGDAIYVEMNKGYLDNININIDEYCGLSSVNGKPILVYNPDKMDEPTINSENYKTIEIDGNKTYYTYTSDASISVGDKLYSENNIVEAILASSENNPAKLMKNINIADRINLELNGQDVYLDLNNWELSCGKECIRTTGENGSLNISNGTLTTSVEGGQALTIGKYRETTYKKMTLNLSNDVTINAIGHGIAVLGNGSILNSAANINVDTLETDLTGIYGITGNGLDNDGTTINITGGAIRTKGTNTAALYLPQLGITKVENATLEGESAIGIKSGTLEIRNSELYATVAKRDPNTYNNGIYPTGDVIFVELNKNYKDNVEISITESELSSVANVGEGESFGEAILIYNPEDMDEINITAPDYSTKIIKENGKKIYYQFTENALMTVGNVGYTFENFQEAIDASTEETPLILKNDYVIPAEETLNIGSGKSFKTDNGVTLTVQGTLNMTSDAIIDLKLDMNGGTVISGGVPITGPENSAYITSNATYYLDTNRNIDVLSGNVILGMSFNTMPGQKLVIKNGATFEIPEGKTLNLYSDLTIEDGATFIVNGTMNIYEGGKVTGNYTTGENGKVEIVTN